MKEQTKEKTSTKLLSSAGLLLVSLLWGLTFVASKYALTAFPPLYLTAIRFLMAFVLMLVFYRKRFRHFRLADNKGGLYGGLALCAAFVCQIYGLQYTTAGKQAFIAGSYVVMVPFIVWMIFKERPRMKAYAGAALCFVGVSLISFTDSFSLGLGDSLTLVSSLLFAVQIVISGYYVRWEDPAVMATIQFGVSGLIALLFAPFLSPLPTVGLFSMGMLSMLYIGIFGSAVAYTMQFFCQRHIHPSTASIIISLETVWGSVFAYFLLQELFPGKMILGAAFILAAIFVSES